MMGTSSRILLSTFLMILTPALAAQGNRIDIVRPDAPQLASFR